MKPYSPLILVNGHFHGAGAMIASAQNRGLRYGEGVFETMLVRNEKIIHRDYHFDRLLEGINAFLTAPEGDLSAAYLETQVYRIIRENKLSGDIRVRLMVFGDDKGLADFSPGSLNWVIETHLLPGTVCTLNEEGLVLGIYRDAVKCSGKFSSFKTNQFLPYLMAAKYADSMGCDDALVLNEKGRIADSSIANLWWEKDNTFFTTSIEEGPVAGTMRRHLLNLLRGKGLYVEETHITPDALKEADAVFLTNAIRGVRWVKSVEDKTYDRGRAAEIFPFVYQD